MKQHLITAACLIAALVSYATGFGLGVLVFVAAGVVLESVFWLRLFRRRQSPPLGLGAAGMPSQPVGSGTPRERVPAQDR